MTQKTQKIISLFVITLAVMGGFEVLVYILNLNQPVAYLHVALWIFAYLVFNIVFFFDLHFKKPGSWQRAKLKHQNIVSRIGRRGKMVLSALWDRFEHLRRWTYLSQWLHFLILPAIIFWSTVALFYVNFGFLKIQQTVALLSGTALILYYMYIKETFFRRKEKVDSDIFVILTVIKVYAAGALYASALAILRYYCLPAWYFSVDVSGYTFLLVYQALYQHRRVNGYTLSTALAIAVLMGIIAQLVYVHWGYNYFTAAIFMTAAYNLFWGTFHHQLDHVLTRRAFAEILLITILVAAMVISVTNFRARILDGCNYSYNISLSRMV